MALADIVERETLRLGNALTALLYICRQRQGGNPHPELKSLLHNDLFTYFLYSGSVILIWWLIYGW